MSKNLKWNQSQFIEQVKKDLESNFEIAGEFLVSEGRKNLLAISDPIWGRNYREQVVARLITYEIEKKSRSVELLFGVAKSSSGSHHGFYIELGSSSAPAHPFIRPAVFNNGSEIIALLEGR